MNKLALFILILGLACVSASSRGVYNDPVSGDWDATMHVVGYTVKGSMSLKVTGDVVSGTVETQHTGRGTVAGTWKDGKLEFTAKFEKHESIDFSGTAKDGKLEGEFKTEGNTGQWLAEPHKAS